MKRKLIALSLLAVLGAGPINFNIMSNFVAMQEANTAYAENGTTGDQEKEDTEKEGYLGRLINLLTGASSAVQEGVSIHSISAMLNSGKLGDGWFVKIAAAALALKIIKEIGVSALSPVLEYAKKRVNSWVNGFKTNSEEEVEKELDKLFSEIKGQEEAKDGIKEYINTVLHDFYRTEQFGDQRQGKVLYMIGPSGTGKSTMAKGIAEAVLEHPSWSCMIIDSSCMDPKSDPVSTFFRFNEGYSNYGCGGGYYGSNKPVTKKSTVIEFLATHPKAVLVINEYDKFFTKNLDEVLRGFIDERKFHVNNTTEVETPELLIIITSNETREKLEDDKRFVPEGRIEPYLGNGSQFDSPLPPLQVRRHDGSFLNRVKIVEFSRLEEENFKEIATKIFEDEAKSYKEKYDIEIKFHDTALEKIMEIANEEEKGARGVINPLSTKLNAAINNKCRECKRNGTKFKDKIYTFYYDSENDEFILKELLPATIVLKELPENWDTVNIYAYNDENGELMQNAEWPGVPMTRTDYGDFQYDLPDSWESAKIIFSNGQEEQIPASNEPGIVLKRGEIKYLDNLENLQELDDQEAPEAEEDQEQGVLLPGTESRAFNWKLN